MPQASLTVGNVEIMALHDNQSALPLSQAFPSVSSRAWAPYLQRYPEGFSGSDKLRVHFECYLLSSLGQTILVDTGMGSMATNPGGVSAFGLEDGRLITELQAAGVQPQKINTVFLTHLHFDHVGWNLTREGASPWATFPNARYVVQQADWDAFKKPENEEAFGFKYWDQTLGPLEELGVLDLISGEKTLTGEITALPTPGHTPGSMSLAVVSVGERALVMGDVFHGPTQVSEPDWVFRADMDPTAAVRTRITLLDRAEAENATMAICHHSGFGRVLRAEGRRYWQAV